MNARAWACVLAGTVLAACQPSPPKQALDRHELKLQARSLAAISAQADLFAQQLQQGSLDGDYAWVHQQALSDEAGDAAKEVAKPAPDDLRASQAQALRLAAALQDQLNRTADARKRSAELERLRARFAALQAGAQALEQAL